jgi:hypothetical protein
MSVDKKEQIRGSRSNLMIFVCGKEMASILRSGQP